MNILFLIYIHLQTFSLILHCLGILQLFLHKIILGQKVKVTHEYYQGHYLFLYSQTNRLTIKHTLYRNENII